MNPEEIKEAMEHCTRCLECFLGQSGAYGCTFLKDCTNCSHNVLVIHKTKLQGDIRDDSRRTN